MYIAGVITKIDLIIFLLNFANNFLHIINTIYEKNSKPKNIKKNIL